MSWQKLGHIDEKVYEFTQTDGSPLVGLRLIGHELTSVPENIGSRVSSLTSLSLASNNLEELPDSICELAQLQEVRVRRRCRAPFLDLFQTNARSTPLPLRAVSPRPVPPPRRALAQLATEQAQKAPYEIWRLAKPQDFAYCEQQARDSSRVLWQLAPVGQGMVWQARRTTWSLLLCRRRRQHLHV